MYPLFINLTWYGSLSSLSIFYYYCSDSNDWMLTIRFIKSAILSCNPFFCFNGLFLKRFLNESILLSESVKTNESLTLGTTWSAISWESSWAEALGFLGQGTLKCGIFQYLRNPPPPHYRKNQFSDPRGGWGKGKEVWGERIQQRNSMQIKLLFLWLNVDWNYSCWVYMNK